MTYNKPGRLILFEGGEGSGKTSQLDAIARWLPSYTAQPITVTREPYQDSIRQLLNHQLVPMPELFLLLSDRAQHFAQVVIPALEAGHLVLCDRGFPSTVAYQGYARGLDIAKIYKLNHLVTEDIDPDLVLWLDAPPELGLQRSGRGDRIEQESATFHDLVRMGYITYAAAHLGVVRFDATEPFEIVTERIQDSIKTALYLWAKEKSHV